MRNKKTNILVVDDDERTRRMMEAMLIPQGYSVTMAKDGREGVETACREKPDLILMDLMMPVMDGFAACYEIKKNAATRSIPVFMLTAVGSARNKQMAQEVWGANGYLTKPVDLEELLNTITTFLPAK